jgi:hypothetical protein
MSIFDNLFPKVTKICFFGGLDCFFATSLGVRERTKGTKRPPSQCPMYMLNLVEHPSMRLSSYVRGLMFGLKETQLNKAQPSRDMFGTFQAPSGVRGA